MTKNEFGVYTDCYESRIDLPGSKIPYHGITINWGYANGRYGYELASSTPIGGFSAPLTDISLKYKSKKECLAKAFNDALAIIDIDYGGNARMKNYAQGIIDALENNNKIQTIQTQIF